MDDEDEEHRGQAHCRGSDLVLVRSQSAQAAAASTQDRARTREAELREHRERRRVRGVPAGGALARFLRARARLATDPDACDRTGLEGVEGDVHESRAAARHVSRRASVHGIRCDRGCGQGGDERTCDQEDSEPSTQSHERDRERDDEERDEARLRVRVEEPPEEERAGDRRRNPVDRPAPAQEDDDQEDHDRHDRDTGRTGWDP